jgi:hypothetical protein
MSFITHPDYLIDRRARNVYESLLIVYENDFAGKHMECLS